MQQLYLPDAAMAVLLPSTDTQHRQQSAGQLWAGGALPDGWPLLQLAQQ